MDILEEKKLSIFKKYYLEASVVFLAVVIGITVRFVINLNDKFTGYIIKDKEMVLIQVEKSNEALNNNNELLKDIKTLLKDKK